MTSVYETAMECDQQSVTTSHESVKICFDALELDNPDPFQMAEQTERSSSTLSSSRASLVASDEEAATFPTEDNTFPINESYENENVNENVNEEKKKREKEDKDDEVKKLNIAPNSMNDTSRTNKSGDEDSLEDTYNNRYEKTKENKKKESVLVSAASHTLADASACRTTRKEQIREERRPSDQNKNKRNQIVLEIQMQERRAASDDNDVHADGNLASATMTDVRVCWENAVKFRHANEGSDEEIEKREIIGQLDEGSKSFYDAVRSGNAKRVSALISGGRVQNLDEPDWNVSGDPPLLVAATNHYLPVLR